MCTNISSYNVEKYSEFSPSIVFLLCLSSAMKTQYINSKQGIEK